MFNYDKWQEILITIRRNKLRTILTMFGVFWGILMLMLLVGSGQGLANGMNREFAHWGFNSVYLWSNTTTKAYQGMTPGREIQFTDEDTKAIKQNFKDVEYLAPKIQLGGFRGNQTVKHKNKVGEFHVMGEDPDLRNIISIAIVEGRFINDLDLLEKRKVAVVGENIIKILFKKGENVIGKSITVNGIHFTIVGRLKTEAPYEFWTERDRNSIMIPFTTFQQTFNKGNRVGWYAMGINPSVYGDEMGDNIRSMLMRRHKVHPEDLAAFGYFNSHKEFLKVQGLSKGMRVFIWFVSLCTLLAGVIGVSNIMIIVVNERTKEIGIRKSIGATPYSIVSLIMQESVFLTSIAGYIGLLLGIAMIEILRKILAVVGDNMSLISRPEINLQAAAIALLVIIMGGVLAGILPARKAALISPMEAIRYK